MNESLSTQRAMLNGKQNIKIYTNTHVIVCAWWANEKSTKNTHTHTKHTDLFDQPIELELGAMDFAGFQMLSDPNATMIADPTIEDSFRRDLN